MSPQRRLIIASIFFAVMWSALMIWWNGPTFAGVIIFTIGGAFTGTPLVLRHALVAEQSHAQPAVTQTHARQHGVARPTLPARW